MEDPRTLLRKYGLHPRKALGQNFLVSPTAPDKIAESAALTRDDTVLEIGAGLGTLTYALTRRAGKVVAVETDPLMRKVLETEFVDCDTLQLVFGDILEQDPADLITEAMHLTNVMPDTVLAHYKVVANLPYYITAAVIRHILEASLRPECMVVTVQREVAKRIVAKPGDMSLLAVSVQVYGVPKLVLRLKRGAFFPAPEVESAVVRIDMHPESPVKSTDLDWFFRVVKAGFSQKRKQLRNALGSGLGMSGQQIVDALAGTSVVPTRRAETLSIDEWDEIAGVLQTINEKSGN